MTVSRHQAVGAYRRWTPTSFDQRPKAGQGSQHRAEPSRAPSAAGGSTQQAVQLPTAEQIEAMYEQAREEGHAAGRIEGVADARAQTERLTAIVDALDKSLDRLDDDIAADVVSLAITMARQMVRHTLAGHPDALKEIVKEALQQIPQAQVRIHIHPDDAALIREFMAEQAEHGHHRLVEDTGIERGGCRLETPASEIDATLPTRWRRVLEALGRSGPTWDEGNA